MRRIPWTRTATLGVCASIASLALAAPATAVPDLPGRAPASATRSVAAPLSHPTPPAPPAAPTTPPPPGAPVKPSKGVTPDEIRKAQEAERYWTPERIRSAVPVEVPETGGKNPDEQRAPAVRGKPSLREPSHEVGAGIATVGVFLIRSTDGSPTPNQFCTANSVTSPTKSLVITAAHCLKGNKSYSKVAFVPGYRAGASTPGQAGETPYGIFPMQEGKVWIDGRYLSPSPYDDVDFAFLRVGPNSRGQLLEDATGTGNTLTTTSSANLARKNVTLIGYPGGQKTPLQCTNDTSAVKNRFMEIKCARFRSGVSGGPFLDGFDGSRGKLVGVIGGYNTGGLSDDVSYSSQFDDDVVRLYDQAVGDAEPDEPNLMGSAGTWQHATVLAAGSFHTASVRDDRSDLIVRWSDGEVSLYPGDGKFGFRKDVQLLKKNKDWEQAQVITAGDFTGDDTDDLFVRWANGRMTLYKDVNETNKLTDAIQLRGPDSTWTHAANITAGRFGGGNTAKDDLVVRWDGGGVTLYTNVDAAGLHAEKQLATSNTTWPHTADLAAGDFSGPSGDQDLFVRWDDGEVTVYEDIAAAGLNKEHQLRPAKSAWRSGLLVTAGAFGGGSGQDDLVALWPKGKLSLYADTTATSLAREHNLVPAMAN
ncbi:MULTISPECIES: trypsin-like serine peptidase [Streptomyces]|uniref:trypsin-like serine peptidase n=1 Tax=Streptomyces TaxID=1883 RepID=UPI003449C467